jgi:hypothetical protein
MQTDAGRSYEVAFVNAIRTELGVDVPFSGGYWYLEKFFQRAELRDVLDAITVGYRITLTARFEGGRLRTVPGNNSSIWLVFVQRIFDEENPYYRVDESGLVHRLIDAEFENNRFSALKALEDPRFSDVKSDFENSFKHLRNGDGKAAVRTIFPAVETAAKVLFPGKIARLMPNEVDRFVLPYFEERYAGNEPALMAARRICACMKEWIIAAQQYRHGQESTEVTAPPEDLVITFLSIGAALLRWLVSSESDVA